MRLWFARALILIVIAWNLQAAFVFFAFPDVYAPGFELAGVPGAAAVRGIALLFVMWNVPYVLACWHPRRNSLSLKEALVMQFIGVIGESTIFLTLPALDTALRDAIFRFILFDGAGLVMLCAAFLLAANPAKRMPTP